MRKFLAVLKREYIQRVRAKMFIVSTILLPVIMSLFGIVPALILSINAGGPMRIAVVDQTGKLYNRLEEALTSDERAVEKAEQNRSNPEIGEREFQLEQVASVGPDASAARANLEARIKAKDLDGYLILPPNFLQTGQAEFFNNSPGDFLSGRPLESALNRAVREQRLIEAKVDTGTRQAVFQPVEVQSVQVNAPGEKVGSDGSRFVLVFAVGFIMYLAILMYGQVILGAVIEEKETRIAEILFSSVRPFQLMMGKLVGVSLVALTQLAVWGTAFAVFALYGVNLLASRGLKTGIPSIPLSHYIYFGLFFLLGYFIYATIYALVGSMVTTTQEGGQLAMPIILILVVSFYLFLPVSRSPDSPFSFWVSMIPFTAPVAMLVRIVTQTPPFWQIALSLLLGFGTVVLIMWIASRIYRVGMLMYGKRASIPEALRWARQP
jgi:ABC-2 type transport system permease protein